MFATKVPSFWNGRGSAQTLATILSSKIQQRLIVNHGFWNTTITKLSILPAQFKLQEQTSLSVIRAREKHIKIRQAHNCSFYSKLNTQLKRTTSIQLQRQCPLVNCNCALFLQKQTIKSMYNKMWQQKKL